MARSTGKTAANSSPVMCVSGEAMKTASAGPRRAIWATCRASCSSVRWLCSAPFGSAVEPEVYISSATSFGSGGSGSGTASLVVIPAKLTTAGGRSAPATRTATTTGGSDCRAATACAVARWS